MSKSIEDLSTAGESVEPPTSEDAPHELTWRSGLATAGATLSYFLSVGFQNAFGIFQEYYGSNVMPDKSIFQISWIGSFTTFVLFLFAPVAGVLADKIGPTIPIAFGSIALLVAIFMTSLCKAYWQFFLAQGLLLGIGMSFISIPATGMVPRYFKKHRGLATGISIAGSSVGGIIWPIAFNEMLHTDGISFPWAMRIAGFIMTPLCALCVLTIRPPLKKQQQSSAAEGAGTAQLDEKQDGEKDQKKKDLTVLRRPPYVLLCTGLFFGILGFFDPYFYVSTYAVSNGLSPSLGFYLVSIINAASFFGRILPGIVADKWGRFNVLTFSSLTAGVVAFCWTKTTNAAGLVVWTIAYGFASGAILSLQLACATTLVSAESAGAAVGTVMGSTSLATLFGPPIAGELVKHGYLALSSFCGTTLIAGACFIAASRLYQNRNLIARI